MNNLFKALFAITVVILTTSVSNADYHTQISREITLARLNSEVTRECGTWSMPFTRCSELKTLLRILGRDTSVATKEDLKILDRLAQLGLKTEKAQSDLAVAIEEAKKLYAHVVNEHGDGNFGLWQDATCGPAPSA